MDRALIADSTSIAEVGYDAETQVLEVMFINGSVYEFYGVPEAIAVDLMSPWIGSAGRYFEMNIREVYPCVQL